MKLQAGQQQLQYVYCPRSQELCSISQKNQTIKFGQLIGYKMRNIFLENSCTKCRGEASPRTFCKKSKLRIYPDQQSEMV